MTEPSSKLFTKHPITYRGHEVPRWRVIELELKSPEHFANPLHEARFVATFIAPSGHHLDWHGLGRWRRLARALFPK